MRTLFQSLLVPVVAILLARPLDAARAQAPASEYEAAILESVRAFFARDWDACLAALDQAEKHQPPNPNTLNARGAIYVEKRQFDKARIYFEESLKLDRHHFPTKFNLCEILFVQKKWAEAREAYRKLQQEYPNDELTKFRIYLTHLLEGQKDEAKRLLEDVPILSDTPVYYFSHAAWEFAEGNQPKALEWIQSGRRVFSHAPEKVLPFNDVFYDLGWLERPKPAPRAPALTRGPAAKPSRAPADNAKSPLGLPNRPPPPSVSGSLPPDYK